MSSDNWIAIIAAVLALIFSLINLYYNIREIHKSRFINIITSERTKWLSNIRKDLADYCSICVKIAIDPGKKDIQKLIFLTAELEKFKTLIILQLNPKDPKDNKIIVRLEKLKALLCDSRFEPFLAELNNLVIDSQIFLKEEWEKIKIEADKGKLR